MSNSRKGDRFERRLVTDLDEASWATLRAPASGGGTDLDRPDVIALQARDNNLGISAYALELKAGNPPIYLSEAEIQALKRWSNKAGATPLIAVSPDKRKAQYDTDRFIAIEDLDRTDSGNYVVRDDTEYRAFGELFE